MKPAAREFVFPLLLMVGLALGPVAAGAQGAPAATTQASYALLAHGNLNALWVAEVKPPLDPRTEGVRTVFRTRTAGDFANWQPLEEIAARTVQLSDRGSELIVLLQSGDWMMLSDSGARSGPLLPGQGRILFIAGDSEAVWALGVDRRATTMPSTAPTTEPATEPATAPATTASTTTTAPAETIGLFSLDQGTWDYQAGLPEDVTRTQALSMVLFDHRPMLAFVGPDRAIHVTNFSAKGWTEPQTIGPLPPRAQASLLNLGNQPVLALEDGKSITVYVAGEKWTGPITLQPTEQMQQCAYHAVAAALGQLRVLCSDGSRKLVEQQYNQDGQPVGKPFSATQPPTIATDQMTYVLIVVASLAFLFAMFSAMSRRQAIAQAAQQIDTLNLAPLGARFAAGVIDATPLLVASMIASPSNSSPDMATKLTVVQAYWLLAGLGVYIVHTMILESVTGRSIGKMLFGLKVVGLDSKPAPAWAMIVRNLLRVVDVALFFLPLGLTLILPLRQRLGDLAGGTIVVRDPEAEEDQEHDQQDQESGV